MAIPKTSYSVEIVNISDTGSFRTSNEDSTCTDPKYKLLLLADGIGGNLAGEVASALAVTEIHRRTIALLRQLPEGDISPNRTKDQKLNPYSAVLRQAISEANAIIYKIGQRDKKCTGMGATLVSCLLGREAMSICHVGDSRVYLFRKHKLFQLTNDHSKRQAIINRGDATVAEIEQTPSNLITRALGMKATVKVETTELGVSSKDIFLLCSDGLSDMVQHNMMESILAKYNHLLPECANELVTVAKEGGGTDNISVILCRCL